MKNTYNIDQIVDDLLTELSDENKKVIVAMTQQSLYTLHHGFGTSIRNAYGLWHDNPLTENWRMNEASRDMRDENGVSVDYSADHPDAVSMAVLQKLWERLQEVPCPSN